MGCTTAANGLCKKGFLSLIPYCCNKNILMSTILHINPKYKQVASFCEQLPQLFLTEGKDIFIGRNHIKCFEVEGAALVVKHFKHLGMLRRIVYTFFRKDKALRSCENSGEIILRGFSTPEPIAYVGVKKGGLLNDLYYVCDLTEGKAVKDGLMEQQPYNERLLDAYVPYVAALHEKGIIHQDLNFTNVLYHEDAEGNYSFELIDVNRMMFFPGSAPKHECLENFTRSWDLDVLYKAMLKKYIEQRGWDDDDYRLAIELKKKHDKKFNGRRRFKAFFKRRKP